MFFRPSSLPLPPPLSSLHSIFLRLLTVEHGLFPFPALNASLSSSPHPPILPRSLPPFAASSLPPTSLAFTPLRLMVVEGPDRGRNQSSLSPLHARPPQTSPNLPSMEKGIGGTTYAWEDVSRWGRGSVLR